MSAFGGKADLNHGLAEGPKDWGQVLGAAYFLPGPADAETVVELLQPRLGVIIHSGGRRKHKKHDLGGGHSAGVPGGSTFVPGSS